MISKQSSFTYTIYNKFLNFIILELTNQFNENSMILEVGYRPQTRLSAAHIRQASIGEVMYSGV